MAGAEEAVFSEIPARTWRWLGVNEARVPRAVMASSPVMKMITVPPGQTVRETVIYREETQAVIRVELGDGATLHLEKVQILPTDMSHADTVTVVCGKGAAFTYTAVELGASVAASRLLVELAGDESRADVAALYFGDGSRRVDLNYVIRQKGRATDAAMDVHGALAGSCDKIFRGTLDFVQGAEGSTGREKEEIVLLSPKVRNRSVPLMLSGEADVDGHHAVSAGKLDEEKLFYLMSRGLDPAEAKRLVVEAQLAPVLSRLGDGALVEALQNRIAERLAASGDEG